MEYRYETHCHSAQCSLCAKSSAQALVYAYQKAGYAGLVLTDHFIYGNTAVPQDLPWAERMQRYYDAYLDAKAVADPLDFDVIFGIEHAYGDGKEVLIYGVELDFLQANPDIPDLTLDALVDRIHEAGGIVIQAHPYREASYIDHIRLFPRHVHGVEIINASAKEFYNDMAKHYADAFELHHFAGSDNHAGPRKKLAGMEFENPISSATDFKEKILAGNGHVFYYEIEE